MSPQEAERFDAHIRLSILRLLSGAPAYRANVNVLHSALADFGLNASRDQIRTQLAWLEEQRLVTTQDMMGLIVAELTERGQDAAAGTVTVPGVQRPGPGA